ncbi:DUF6701 domain-containing protein [Vibrio sp. 10N.261.46.E11]|uniref:DUF6701 domain-containing protein n=1 Tax=Vibrio sp. 10N.261.46.E11 TaxID=3229662 RepID=UPI00354DCBA7
MRLLSRISVVLFILFSVLFQTKALANQCLTKGTEVDARNGFCFTFQMDSDGSNRVRLEGSYYFPIWTDDTSYRGYGSNIYERDYVAERKQRTFQVKFTRTSNLNAYHIKGMITYSVDGVTKGSPIAISLTQKTGVNKWNPKLRLNVIGRQFNDRNKYCISSGNCGALPAPPVTKFDDARFEFGRLNSADCKSADCTITFNKTYRTTPLVFLMPTIDPVNPDSDAPATLSIKNISSTQATFHQEVAPQDSSYNLASKPMSSISYLVVEPGTITFSDGHKAIAGYLDTKAYQAHDKRSSPKWELVPYSRFSSHRIDGDDPVVFAQVNSPTSRWLTAGVDEVNETNAKFYLELTRVDTNNPPFQTEKIAFLVSDEHDGTSNGIKYEFGRISLDDDSGSSTPLLKSCNDMHDLENEYQSLPGIVASKITRKGGHGGWLRLCSVKRDGDDDYQVGLVVDEDLSLSGSKGWRSHTDEKIGYFAFQVNKLPKFRKDYCSAFPSAVQGWKNPSGSRIEMSNNSKITNALLEGGQRKVGFGSALFSNAAKCDGISCTNDPAKQIVQSKLDDFLITNSGSDIWNTTKTLTPFSQKSLSIGQSTVTLTAGSYYFNSLDINNSSSLNIQGKVIIHTRYFSLSNNSRINNSGNADNLVIVGYDPTKGSSGEVCPAYGCKMDLSSQSQVKALIYSEGEVLLSNSSHVYGSVTARKLHMSGTSQITGESQCFSEPELVITPGSSSGLACAGIPINFKLVDKITKQPVNNYTGTLDVTIPNNSSGDACWLNSDNSCSTSLTHDFVAGQTATYTKSLSSIGLSPVSISASIRGKSNISATGGPYQFVPYGFKIEDKQRVDGGKGQVAYRNFETEVTAVASGAANPRACQKISDYDGTKSLHASYEQITQGNSGWNNELFLNSYNIKVGSSPLNGTKVNNIAFQNGVAKLTSQYWSAGHIKLHLADANWQPASNPIPNWKGLQSSTDMYVRPFALVSCQDNSGVPNAPFPSGSSTGGASFIAAGDIAYLAVSAIAWDANADRNNDGLIDSSFSGDLCRNLPVSGFDDETVYVNYALDSPSNGHNGVLSVGGKSSGDESSPQPIPVDMWFSGSAYKSLSWSEVGSIKLWAEKPNYLNGMTVPGYKTTVGRFYPKYFQVVNSAVWDYPGNQSYAYMNQPFDGVTFNVEALNAQASAVKNYGYFAPQMTASFALYEANPAFVSRFHSGTPSKSWASISGKSIGTFNLDEDSPSTNCASELCWAKAASADGYEDGPFNTVGGTDSKISIDAAGSNSDPIDYQPNRNARLLTVQPIVRFGRAVMDSLGGVVGDGMNIPFRIEHWSGANFATHDGDNTTNIRGVNIESANRDIWVEPGSTAVNVALSGGGGVVNGVSNSMRVAKVPTAPEDSEVRQQTQVWLELSSGGNAAPWLRYRWQDPNRVEVAGEEDPSTVVTFGIHRGNDRVIYRGENGLIGQ